MGGGEITKKSLLLQRERQMGRALESNHTGEEKTLESEALAMQRLKKQGTWLPLSSCRRRIKGLVGKVR